MGIDLQKRSDRVRSIPLDTICHLLGLLRLSVIDRRKLAVSVNRLAKYRKHGSRLPSGMLSFVSGVGVSNKFVKHLMIGTRTLIYLDGLSTVDCLKNLIPFDLLFP